PRVAPRAGREIRAIVGAELLGETGGRTNRRKRRTPNAQRRTSNFGRDARRSGLEPGALGQLVVFQFESAIAFLGFLQGAAFFAQTLLQIPDTVFELDRHSGGR